MVLESQLGIIAGLQVGTESEGLRLQLTQLRVAIAIMVVRGTVAALPKEVDTRLMIVRHQRGVHGRIIIRTASPDHRQRMGNLGRVAHRFLRDDIDRTGDSGRAEQGRASSAHHLYPLDHICRDLLQAIYAGQGAEDRPAIHQDLGIRAFQTNGGGLKFDLFSRDYHHRLNVYTSAQHTKRQSYYGAGKDPNAYGNTTDMTFIGGAQYSYEWDKCLFMPATFTGGAEYSYDDLQDEMLGYHRTIAQTVHIGSAFAQNEWKNDRWSFLIGGRLDKHNMMDHVIFSPRANVRFNPTKDINLRMSYSSGFRAPQAFDEDLHITAVGGDVAIIQISPDLKEENSQSVSASVDFYHRFGPVQVNFLVEGFYTDLRNVFILEEIGRDEDNNLLMERRNGKGARVMGINLEGKMVYSWMQIQAGATLQRSRYKEAEQWSENPNITPQKKMFRSPDVYGYFTSTFTPVKRFSASLTGTYTGSMLVQHLAGYIPEDREEKTRDFFDLNLKLSYDFPIFKSATLQVNAGIQNIFDSYQDDFDKGAHRDAGYIYGPGIPRSYFVGCKISY